jgi:hypothetical protein
MKQRMRRLRKLIDGHDPDLFRVHDANFSCEFNAPGTEGRAGSRAVSRRCGRPFHRQLKKFWKCSAEIQRHFVTPNVM